MEGAEPDWQADEEGDRVEDGRKNVERDLRRVPRSLLRRTLIRVSGFGFRVWVSGVGFRVPGFMVRGSVLGLWSSGFG